MNNSPTLTELTLYFALLSLMAIGGANAVIPDMHRQFVELRGWMSGTEFVETVALAQAAPGPNVLLVSLLGWKLYGFAGAVVATVAVTLPSSLLVYGFAHLWRQFVHTRWQAIIRDALAPLTIGLVLSSGYVLARTADQSWMARAITGVTVVAVLTTKIHPLWLLGAAGVIGFIGFV